MAQPVIELPAFDQLKAMANDDPQALELLRKRLVSEVIERAPLHQRPQLSGLQFVLDMERRRARNPMQCCIRISELMHERVECLRRCFRESSHSDDPLSSQPNYGSRRSAVILNFPDAAQDVLPKS